MICEKKPCLRRAQDNPHWSPRRHPCWLGSIPSRHGGRRIESAYRVALLLAVSGDSTCLVGGMFDWCAGQYSSASMIVITRLVTVGSEASGECIDKVLSK